MEKVTKEQKNQVVKKFLEFQLKGLLSYRKYLEKEFKNSAGKEIKKAYHNYIANELEGNKIKIEKINAKL